MSHAPTHPQLRALLHLWSGKRGARRMPARRDFDVLELGPWLGHLHLVEVVDGGRDFLHRVYGTALALTFGTDFTGKPMAAIPEAVRDLIRQSYAQVQVSGEPRVVDDDPLARSAIGRVEKLILPLSSDGVAVDRLLIGAYGRYEGIGERRGQRRVPVRLTAIVETAEGCRLCFVRNYSPAGAKLQFDGRIAPTAPIVVAFGPAGRRTARLVWQGEGQAGIAFTDGEQMSS